MANSGIVTKNLLENFMFNRTIITISICLFQLSAARADSDSQRIESESTMSILADVEAQGIKSSNLEDFLSAYDVSSSVKSLVSSYVNQGLSSSDFTRMDYGLYAITGKNDSSLGDVVINATCVHMAGGTDYCFSQSGSNCSISQGHCE